MTRTTRFIIGAVLGIVISGLYSAYMALLAAPSAVRVRPSLETVGFWSAAFTNHGADWLYYHEPVLTAIVAGVVAAVVGGLMLLLP